MFSTGTAFSSSGARENSTNWPRSGTASPCCTVYGTPNFSKIAFTAARRCAFSGCASASTMLSSRCLYSPLIVSLLWPGAPGVPL